MDTMITLFSKSQVKKFLLYYQGLLAPIFNKKEGVMEYFDRVGCIQYDPLTIIARNADLVLQSRIKNYQETMLNELLYKDRLLIDGWDKQMSIYPISDYPFMKPIRERQKNNAIKTMQYRNTTNALDMIDDVLSYVTQNGPTYPHDLKSSSSGSSNWGSNKLSSVALDYLYNTGVLAIANKKNAVKQYDLIENLYPQELLHKEFPYNDNFKEWIKLYLLRKINSIGLYWSRSSIVYQTKFTSNAQERNKLIKELVDEGLLILINIIGSKYNYYISLENYQTLVTIDQINYKEQVMFIAPLDNVLWDRDFVKEIFDFDYVWEVYKPETLRKYGYYVIPVLYKDTFVGRFEAKYNRKTKEFILYNWWWEHDTKLTKSLYKQTDLAIKRFMTFLGAKELINLSTYKN